ncbi:hypothetical protein NM208_g5258 [Fusarium decemcellulare]|uniref:Uncharacterized protein n=1 Tax=Fusarium decemcellulare TaxID=57161 RepID=A0ACC1SHZ1_9HYPO|nr:hypothetical protein NM208_g5258 [Fusarium decemcellulare]
MPPKSRSRAMTFTGCWTCKARKVRCDERPLACKNCEKRGVTCGGYGIRLQWMSDPLTQPDLNAGVQGRRSLQLDKSRARYNQSEIDKLLFDLDQCAESGLSSRQGPFSAFPALSGDASQASTSPESGPTVPVSPIQTDVLPQSPMFQDVAIDKQQDSPSETALWFPLDSPNFITTSFLELNASLNARSLAVETSPNEQQLIRQSSPFTNSYALTPSSDLSPYSPDTDYRLIRHIHTNIFGDDEIDSLMSHYNIHVAELLQAIDHSGNPFRTLYLSTALEGVSHRVSDIGPSTAKVYTALCNSLAAAAAFHRWNCDKRQIKHREMGAKYRYHAIQLLQDAVGEVPPVAHYKLLMIAVMSLVTIGIMSGEGDDFRLHINAAYQLRSLRSRWKLVSRSSKQLNEIGAFLALLARTIAFQASASPWNVQDDVSAGETMIIQSSGCYEYVYGVTPTIAAAIHHTCHLAEHLARFRNEKRESLPDDFLEACEELGNKLQSWQLASENIFSIPKGDGLRFSMLTHQANAWHGAALIYYYTRIQGAQAAHLVQEVECVAEHLHAAEDAKLTTGTIHQRLSMAPITWPALIASCNALGGRRDTWRKWWERIELYNIANNSKQWDIVQKIWDKMDQREQDGEEPLEWMELFDIIGIQLLPT